MSESPDSRPARPVHATRENLRFNAGRRPEIRYRDLFVQEATNGRMRAEVMHVSPGQPTVPTGWHYHDCDLQFLYVLDGWVDMEIDGLGPIRVHAGESLLIPGGTVHRELRSSDRMELLEVSVPAALGVVNCDPPAGAHAGAAT